MKRRHPEDDLQAAVAETLNFLGWFWWHTPNGSFLHGDKAQRARQGARLKRLGVLDGVSDIIIMEPWSRLADENWPHEQLRGIGIAIELKIKPNTPTKGQKAFLARAKEHGMLAESCYSIDEVHKVLRLVRPKNGRRFK